MALARSPQISLPQIRLPQRWAKRRFLLIALATWFLIITFWQAPIVHPQAKPIDNATASHNLHATWMTHLGASLMYHTTRLDETIADLAKQNINTLYPAVWNHGHALFSSQTVQTAGGQSRNPWINLPLPGNDLMQGLVDQAHRQNIRLIPWFEYGLMIPSDADVLKQHPEWLTQTQAHTTPQPLSNHPLGALRQAVIGREQVWLNPFHPEVQTFLTNMILDVVRQYPVEGIQLDDHFGLPIDYGYDPYTIALYKADHAGNPPPNNSADPEWVRWRADRLSQLIQRISQAVKSTRPGAILSLSPNTPDFAYRKYLQDWPRWVEQKWIDEVVVQLYRPQLDALKSELNRPNLKAIAQQIPVSIGLYTGPFNGAKAKQRVAQETNAVKAAGYAGTSFFCWETTFWLFRGK